MLRCLSKYNGLWRVFETVRMDVADVYVWSFIYDSNDTPIFYDNLPVLEDVQLGEYATLEQAFVCESHPYNQSLT